VSRKARTNIRPALQERSREKRDRLIKAGLSVFSRRGYAQTRMADVAAEAGVSVGVLYQRFKDKRGFFEVIVDTLAKRLERDVNEFFDEADDAWDLHELIERVVATLVEVVERDVGFFLALITVGEEVPGVIGRIAATDRLRARRLHKLVTERGLVDRVLIDEDKVFFALATAIRMLLVTATVDREPIRLRAPETLTELAAMLTGYLQAS
jgi:AcrR family transcriptional regulator